MRDLLVEIQCPVLAEYQRAKAKFGAANNSAHESYAVILEEFEEAQNEEETFDCYISDYWTKVKSNYSTGDDLSEMQSIAEKAAAEWVQVAAMCYKATIKKSAPAATGADEEKWECNQGR